MERRGSSEHRRAPAVPWRSFLALRPLPQCLLLLHAVSCRSGSPCSGRPYLVSVSDQASSFGSCGWWQPANKLNTAADHGAHPSSVEGVLNLYQFLGIAEGQSAAASDRIGAEQQKTIRNTTGPGLNRRVATTATLWN
ncbi:hypothetical protein PAHAL_9G087500 [Panicum hallii]|jgi:hypothetical protein|uniref:Uncharacterized protein n=1 Tax=Panicum hallii TaxID=206008 RepID=A0A2S3II54_9POAL|nr:hypothetical protein PAHAL_9G087500 [Panicum hallii]